jgi:hypothetical protein
VLEVRGGEDVAVVAPAADEPLTKKQKKQQKKDAKAAEASSTPKPAKGSKSKPATPAKKETDAAPDSDDDGGEAEEIQLSGFTFSTDLTATPPPAPSTPISKKTAEISPEKRLEQKARLEARIQQLRAKRNADSPDGTPARNRNELMAARRKEEAQTRKERKKEQRVRQRVVKSAARPGSSSGGVVVGTPRGTPVPTSAPAPAVTTPAPKPASTPTPASVAAPGSNSAGKAAEKQKKKKAGAKKSRPGFEGSIKAGKGGSSKIK